MNLSDTCHLECLTWAFYEGALLVGSGPELPGDHQWCTVLAGIFKHIYSVMKQHTARLKPWHHGTVSRGLNCFVRSEDKVLHGVGTMTALEIKAFPLVRTSWCKTDVDLMMVSVKCCWKPTPRTLHHQRENGPTTHVISYLNELAVHLPTRKAWDKMVWPTTAVIL